MADVAVPEHPGDEITPINGVNNEPSRADEQLFWLERGSRCRTRGNWPGGSRGSDRITDP
jgi:hypothetical protein